MAKRGRPPLGTKAKSDRILICMESWLREGIEELAEESQRSLSDYCRYVLEQHFWAVKEEEKEEGKIDEPEPDEPDEPANPPSANEVRQEPQEEPEFTCGICLKSFSDCECAQVGYR